jgi:hypothetical protein
MTVTDYVRESRSFWPAIEKALIILVALHSVAIGVGALVATEWGLKFGGFAGASPLFFPRQVGVFHIVAASAYLIEFFQYRGVAILITAKTIAVVFLMTMMAMERLPWVVPFSAVGDALMVLAVLAVHLRSTGAVRSLVMDVVSDDESHLPEAKSRSASAPTARFET